MVNKEYVLLNKFKKTIVVTLISLTLSFGFVFGLAESGFYFSTNEKLEKYAKEILGRSDNLIEQIKFFDQQRDEFLLYTPCSEQFLHILRVRLWPYPLIKDIAYVNDGKVYCSALWGKMSAPVILNIFKNKIKNDSYTWILDAEVDSNIIADILYTDNFAITISPFAFRRFWDEAVNMHFNAIVGDYNHEHHFFKIGFDVATLESIEHNGAKNITFIMVKSCSEENNICVTAGTQFHLFEYHNSYVLFFLILIYFVISLLVYFIINSHIDNKKTLAARLEIAILNKELKLVYQPIHKVIDQSIVGIEVLLRWNDEEIGNIGPDIFIPLAEKNGLIDKISIYVVENSIKECRDIIDSNLLLSINVNCSDICSKKFKDSLMTVLNEVGVSGSSIVLEMTERQNANIEELQHSIAAYADTGILFALDDFGTGYSNLNWLSLLDVDEIKIDKSLIDSIGTESINKHVLPGIVEIFKDMPKIIVFEGIENEAQYNFLKDKMPNCYVQGWYFSKALYFNDLKIYLSETNTFIH